MARMTDVKPGQQFKLAGEQDIYSYKRSEDGTMGLAYDPAVGEWEHPLPWEFAVEQFDAMAEALAGLTGGLYLVPESEYV